MIKRGAILLFLFILVSIVSAQTYNKIGDELSAGGKNVKIIDIGSIDVLVDVGGKRGDIFINSTETVNGINVTVKDIFYHSNPVNRLVWIEMVVAFEYRTQTCTKDEECNDNDPCTLDKCTGNPSRCDYGDSHFTINYCLSGDKCCNPDYCGAREDLDCAAEPQCDDDSDCREDREMSTYTVCEDGFCRHKLITECISGDGYCPDGCYHSLASDQDCSRENKCTWNSECNDDNPCTVDSCKENQYGIKECYRELVTQCISGDECCPTGCSINRDNECSLTGEINQQQGGTIVRKCSSDEECGENSKCVDGICHAKENQNIENVGGFLSRLISFLRRLFLPG